MTLLVIVSLVAWIALAVVFATEGTLTHNGRRVDSPLLRFAVAFIGWPIAGIALYVCGWVGSFMLLPFARILGLI